MNAARGDTPWRRGQDGSAPAYITGLAAEARLLRSLGHQVYVGGGTAEGAARCAEAAIAAGATALISFGLAGGLDPSLPSGAFVRPRCVVWQGRVFFTDPALGAPTCETLLAQDAIVGTGAEKHVLWTGTQATAIDMESGAVGEAAARNGLPFAVLRAICDPATRDLPPAALAALDKSGRIGFLTVAASVLGKPGQIAALLTLAKDAARARKTLIGEVKKLAARDHPARSHAFPR